MCCKAQGLNLPAASSSGPDRKGLPGGDVSCLGSCVSPFKHTGSSGGVLSQQLLALKLLMVTDGWVSYSPEDSIASLL